MLTRADYNAVDGQSHPTALAVPGTVEPGSLYCEGRTRSADRARARSRLPRTRFWRGKGSERAQGRNRVLQLSWLQAIGMTDGYHGSLMLLSITPSTPDNSALWREYSSGVDGGPLALPKTVYRSRSLILQGIKGVVNDRRIGKFHAPSPKAL